MTATASVLYANKPGARFDLDYYLSTHMPLVEKNWAPYGLKSWQIVQYDAGLGGAEAAFTIQAILTWDSAESISTATTSDAAKIVFGDVPVFTDIQPVFIGGKEIGASK